MALDDLSEIYIGEIEEELLFDSVDDLLCELCDTKPKAKKQAQCYTCLTDIKAADKDAKSESKEALDQFRKSRKKGGPEFKLVMIKWKAKCGNVGRGFARPPFGWCKHFYAVAAASKVQAGTTRDWLSRTEWMMRLKA